MHRLRRLFLLLHSHPLLRHVRDETTLGRVTIYTTTSATLISKHQIKPSPTPVFMFSVTRARAPVFIKS